MRIIFLFLIFSFIVQIIHGQVETKFFPKGDGISRIKIIKDHPKANIKKELPSFNVQKLIDEDKLFYGQPVPFRFGKGFDISLTLKDGKWIDVDGGRLWSMEFCSKGAYSINFVFDKFYLPDSAKLYIVNVDGTILYGPVTSKQNTKNGYFLTDLIQGDDVSIYLFEPTDKKGQTQVTIKRVVHAYINLFPELYGTFESSLSCNNNIACFPAWDIESDAIALVLLSDGTEWCSGSLLMTTDQSFKSYFLSAFHCIDINPPYGNLSTTEITNAENWMFKFQYKMATCTGNTATTGITYNGSEFKAAWNNSDFALMELDNSLVGNTQFSWLGWDRSLTNPTSGTGIHHPRGDIMKISFDYDNLISNNSPINWNNLITSPENTHWVVGYDNGTTEGGSSGSPIFNQNKKVIGQLHGGGSGCAPVTKYYGKFPCSWNGGGTNETRLSNWLDPCNSGLITTNTARSPYISGPSIVCTSGSTFTVNNLPDGCTISWTYSPYIESYGSGNDYILLRAIGIGSGWVRVSINSSCGTFELPQKDIWCGLPTRPNNINFSHLNGTCYYQAYTGSLKGVVHYLWSEDNKSWGAGDNEYGFFEPNTTYKIYVKTQNECGTSDVRSVTKKTPPPPENCMWKSTQLENEKESKVNNSEIDDFFIIYPNPASSQVEISILLDNKETIHNIENTEFNVNIFNSFGVRVISIKKTGTSFTIPTSSLAEGLYIIEVNDGNKVYSKQLIIKNN